MDIQAIVYSSNAGHTEEYATLFAKSTGLAVYELKEAKALPKNAVIVYFGWIMGDNISGLKKAAQSFNIAAAAGVGMSESTDEQRTKLANVNSMSRENCFYLRGGLDISCVRGIYRMMLKAVMNSAEKDPAKQNDAATRELVEMVKTPKSFVSADNLAEIMEWYNTYTI